MCRKGNAILSAPRLIFAILFRRSSVGDYSYISVKTDVSRSASEVHIRDLDAVGLGRFLKKLLREFWHDLILGLTFRNPSGQDQRRTLIINHFPATSFQTPRQWGLEVHGELLGSCQPRPSRGIISALLKLLWTRADAALLQWKARHCCVDSEITWAELLESFAVHLSRVAWASDRWGWLGMGGPLALQSQVELSRRLLGGSRFTPCPALINFF